MSVARMLDVNANRAREGLRVLEDYARFVLEDDGLCAELKGVRHELSAALAGVLEAAILHRDIDGDVGRQVKTGAELSREGLGHVVTAAGKRLGESLRSLEEYLKVEHPGRSRAVEAARYRFYELERRLALTLRPPVARLESARLYVLISESGCRGGWEATARACLEGGADVLQLREKQLDGGELLARAVALVAMARPFGTPVIINDRPDVALLAGAAGVHLGQTDLPAALARRILGPDRIVGVSTHEPTQARQARLDGADYIGAGPVFRSATKPRDISPGLAYLRALAGFPIPVFAIAGISPENLAQVTGAGIGRVAVASAVTASDDPAAACRRLKALLSPDAASSR